MPTNNPVPSTDPTDLLFNAQKLDQVVSGSAQYYTDRLGVNRRTVEGINAAADVVLGGLGYAPPVTYASGISLTLTTQTIEYAGEVYAPKVASLPFTTSTWVTDSAKFRLIQGVAATDLAASGGAAMVGYDGGTVQDVLDAVTGPNGAASVGYTPAGTGAVATNVQTRLREHDAALANVEGNLNFTTLPSATTPIASTDLLLLRQGSDNKKVQIVEVTNAAVAAVAPSVAQAQAAQTAAEAARDAAMAGANVYDTTAAGLAATTNGQQFMVVSGNEIIRYRRDSATVATEVARYPTAGGSMIYRGAPASASMDFNTVTTPGLWLINGGQFNPPAGVTYPGLFVVRNFGTWVQQEYIPTGGSTQYGGKKWSRLINTSPSSIGAWVANYGYMGQLGTLPDLNTIRTAGVYHVNSAPYNRPGDTDATNQGLLEVSVVGDYVVQKYMSYGSDFIGLIWTRTITDSTNTIGNWYRNDLYQGSLATGDVNTLTKTGCYLLSGQLTNCPLASGWLNVSRRGDYVLQELKPLYGGPQYTRTHRISANYWWDWTPVVPPAGSVNSAMLSSQYDYRATLTSGDVNNYVDSGGWMVTGAMSNAPSGSGWLIVNKFGSTGQFVVQRWIDFNNTEITFSRKLYGGVWSAWKTPISSDKGGKKIVCLGDSVTQIGDYPDRLRQLTGSTVIKAGFSGSQLAGRTGDYDYLSMYRIAEYINTGNWQPLIDACERLAGPPTNVDYRPIAAALAAVDWSTVDYIVAFHGTNDFAGSVPIGSDADATGTTLKGAVNYTVDKICSAYPNIKMMFVAPMWRSRILGSAGTEDTDVMPNSIGKYLIEYVDAIVSRSNANKMPAIDLYRTSGINKYNWQTLIADGLHPTTGVGYQRVAEKIAAGLKANW